jgi:hypothetical protein
LHHENQKDLLENKSLSATVGSLREAIIPESLKSFIEEQTLMAKILSA